MVEIHKKPQLVTKVKTVTPHPTLSLGNRMRAAVQVTFNCNPKEVRSHRHGLRINLRNMATEVDKLESALAKWKAAALSGETLILLTCDKCDAPITAYASMADGGPLRHRICADK